MQNSQFEKENYRAGVVAHGKTLAQHAQAPEFDPQQTQKTIEQKANLLQILMSWLLTN